MARRRAEPPAATGSGRSGVVVDVRALQAPSHATRGIGRYTLDVIRGVEAIDPDLVRAYLVDPAFPIHERARRLLDTGKLLRWDHRSLRAHPPSVLHLTSPFVEAEGNVEMLPGWAIDGSVRLVATVYDLIPARFPEVYLVDPDAGVEYRARCQLLRSCDRLLSISEATTADLVELLDIPEARVVTVHGAAGEEFVPPSEPLAQIRNGLTTLLGRDVSDGYVLCPTGIEWRKNLDRMLVAWSRVDPTTRRTTPLVVQCDLTGEARVALVARCGELGIGDDVMLTGSVTSQQLVALLHGAELVVFPSFYEGLGLPVLEAQACGAAVVVGDNSSLRELVDDPAGRFDAHNVEDIARAVAGTLADPELRRRLADAGVGPEHRGPRVAAAVTATYRELLGAAPRTRPRRPARLAITSPVPPQLSGPSAYMDELLAHLPDHCDVTLFSSVDPSAVQLKRPVRTEHVSTLRQLELVEGPFDEVLHVLGNSEHHIDELAALRRRPGAVLLHDARLTLLYSETHRLRPELLPGTFGELLHRMYPGRYADAMGGAQFLPMHEESEFGVLMVEEVARLATRLFVHSEHAADLIELDCGRRPEVAYEIPSPVIDPVELAGLRDTPDDEHRPLVASFGFVSPAKCSDTLLEAVLSLRDARLALVGHSGDDYLASLRRRAAEVGATGRVTVTGRLHGDEYRRWLARADLAVQLRLHSNGESSASVAETLAAGVPTVVSDVGTFAEYPDDVVVKVPAGIDPEALRAVLAELLADVDRRRELSAAARSHAAAHDYAGAAAALVETLLGRQDRDAVARV